MMVLINCLSFFVNILFVFTLSMFYWDSLGFNLLSFYID